MAGVPPKRAEAYTLHFSVTSQANPNIFQTTPTIAAGDFQVSVDGGATFANPATLPSVCAGWNKLIQAPLAIAEMTPTVGDQIIFRGSSAGAEWQDILIVLTVSTSTIDDLNTLAFPAGAVNFTYTITDSVTGLPIPGVEVWISTDLAGTNRIWRGTTDSFGVARDAANNLPALNAGTYYFWRKRSGYTFSDPDTEVVS